MSKREHYILLVLGILGLGMMGYSGTGIEGMLYSVGAGLFFYVIGRSLNVKR